MPYRTGETAFPFTYATSQSNDFGHLEGMTYTDYLCSKIVPILVANKLPTTQSEARFLARLAIDLAETIVEEMRFYSRSKKETDHDPGSAIIG